MESDQRYREVMTPARRRVAEMDKVDGCGMDSLPADEALRTVMSALDYAIRSQDWGGVGDAQVMLQQIEFKYRPADQKHDGHLYMDERQLSKRK